MSGSRTALAPDPTADGLRVARSFRAARRHSSFVRLLKIAIPLGSITAVAVVALASVFNPFARMPGLTVGPVTVSGSKIAMESPRLTGFRRDKRPYEVTATNAFQDIRKPNVIELENMKARLTVDDSGGTARLVAKSGIYDSGKDHLDLSQNIRLTTNKGEEVLLRSASIDLKAGAVSSREPVQVRTPTLTVDAQGLELTESGKVIVFTGRVRTVLLRGMNRDGEPDPTPKPDVRGAGPKITQAEPGERR